TVEKETRKLAGVEEARVNLATEKMVVKYDSASVAIPDIIQAVSKAGYAAHEDAEVDDSTDKKQKNIDSMWARFLWSAIFTAPLFCLSMGYMVGILVPGCLEPSVKPEWFSTIQLILTMPVIALGQKFYSVGFKTLLRGHPNMDSLIALGTSAAFTY